MQTDWLTYDITGPRQRSDLTFKHNANHSRHGWLRLTPAYSVKLVNTILQGRKPDLQVFDPFSGTATTPLAAAYLGHQAVAIDINPFLVWFGEIKLKHFRHDVIMEAIQKIELINSAVKSGHSNTCPPPSIFNIDRWWNERNLGYLCSLKGEIDQQQYLFTETRDLLLVAFCRCLIEISNAAFNHQSMSFKQQGGEYNHPRFWTDDDHRPDLFSKHVEDVLDSASINPAGHATVLFHDARNLNGLSEREFDILISSPPYPNRMSYIRELRPYMYWLGYLHDAREAGELDWRAIGGTWGIATSRLSDWRRNSSTYFPHYLEDILHEIIKSDGKSGPLLSSYVGKYFEDIWRHFLSVGSVMKRGGELHYIIGNSKFYDSLVPTEQIYADMMKKAGFVNIHINTLRKRNSKKELMEYEVIANTNL